MEIKDYCVLDLESNGFYPEYFDDIIEVCILKVKNDEVVDKFHSYMKPYKEIPEEVIKLTGITNDMVKDAPDRYKLIPKIREFIGDDICIAHNTSFDIYFLNSYFRNMNLPFILKSVCTLNTFKKYSGLKKGNNLGAASLHFGIKLDNAHTAEDDTFATYELFKSLKTNNAEIVFTEEKEEIVLQKILKRFTKAAYMKEVLKDICLYEQKGELKDNSILQEFQKGISLESLYENYDQDFTNNHFLNWINNSNINKYIYLIDKKSNSWKVRKEILKVHDFDIEKSLLFHINTFGMKGDRFKYELVKKIETGKFEEVVENNYSYEDFKTFFESGQTIEEVITLLSINEDVVIENFVKFVMFSEENKEMFRSYITDNILKRKELQEFLKVENLEEYYLNLSDEEKIKNKLSHQLYINKFFKGL